MTIPRYITEKWNDDIVFPEKKNIYSKDDIYEYVKSFYLESESFDEGSLVPSRIDRFLTYKLVKLPLDYFNEQEFNQNVSDSLVDTYANESNENVPPIIVDSVDKAIIDGFHRLNASIKRGDLFISAYVGDILNQTWKPHKDHPYPVKSKKSPKIKR